MSTDLESRVSALETRQEVLEKRQALLEQSVARLATVCTEIQGDVRAMQRDQTIGFAAVRDQLKALADTLEVVRRKAVGNVG